MGRAMMVPGGGVEFQLLIENMQVTDFSNAEKSRNAKNGNLKYVLST